MSNSILRKSQSRNELFRNTKTGSLSEDRKKNMSRVGEVSSKVEETVDTAESRKSNNVGRQQQVNIIGSSMLLYATPPKG